MRKTLAVLLALLLLPAIPNSGASSSLIEVGVVDSVDGRFVHASFSSGSTLMTLTTDGNLSEHFWGSGELITQWSVELNITAKSATPDWTGLQVAVAHSTGVLVINTENKTITRNYNISTTVDFVEWDTQGELWFGHSGGERRAKEYDQNTWTTYATTSHNTAMTAMTIISEDRIVTGGRDNLVKVFTQDGTEVKSLSDFSSYPTKIINDGSGNILVGCANGDLFRYDFATWNMESLRISSDHSIISINIDDDGDILVGTQNGRLHIIDSSTFTEEHSFESPGRVMNAKFGSNGELYIISAFSTSSKVRLFDLDTDGDGITDSLDAFPLDETQTVDTDGDGFGDNEDGNNSDAFPLDQSQWIDSDGDGYGDNPDGNDSDAFPNNSDQWADGDGDGYGDNMNGEQGDRYPEDSTQWSDRDYDGFGDEVDGTNGDHCPDINGFSTEDRRGCPDSDGDGFSNPDDDWTVAEGADSSVNDKTQWSDMDGDGYGDNLTGNQPDSCPLEAGTSTMAWLPVISNEGELSLTYEVQPKYGCVDTDGDGYYDFGDDLPNDPNDYIDADKDDVGASMDYNDSNKLIQTVEDHCGLVLSDTSETCQGLRDTSYLAYVSKQTEDGKSSLSYYDWQSSKEDNDKDGEEGFLDTLGEIAPFLGGGFGAILFVLLLFAGVTKMRRRRKLVKTYGVPFVPSDANSAETEALEGKAGLSASGGVESDKLWDDDIEPMELGDDGSELGGGFDDIAIKSDDGESGDVGVMEESASMEELAGLPAQTTAEEMAEPQPAQAASTDEAPEAPPLPAEGLPPGWTMDQWKWYGAEWLAKNGK